MNQDTVDLIERPFAELVDDLLTSVAGGVVNERIVFDVKQDLYPLAQPAAALRTITGFRSVSGEPQSARYAFQVGADAELDPAHNAVAWLDGARPADDTPFYVDYLRAGATPPITDLNIGSVTRVLIEAVGHEFAMLYEQINEAYRAAFLDTASGRSLDLVVAILGLVRRRASSAAGLVTFYRAAGEDGAITIPAGLALRTRTGTATFEVSQQRTLQRGQAAIDVPVRAATGFEGQAGVVAAGEITVVSTPLNGIDHISNAEATVLGTADETDDELRLRARTALAGLGKGTLAALINAVDAENGKVVEVWDPAVTARPSPAGTVTLLVEAQPDRFDGVQSAVQETRAAGVAATVLARYVFFTPRIALSVKPGLPAAGQDKVVADVIAALRAVVDGLNAGQPAVGADLAAAARRVDGFTAFTFRDVLAWRADVTRPGPETLVDAVVAAAATAAGDASLLRAAVTGILAAQSPVPPTPARIPDRSLVVGPGGGRATDDEIAADEFRVVTPADGTWWVYLTMTPADVVVT